MKTATSKNGEIIEANPEAPDTAICTYCGSPVILRKRRTMLGAVTYFWRHRRGSRRPCQMRARPIPGNLARSWKSQENR